MIWDFIKSCARRIKKENDLMEENSHSIEVYRSQDFNKFKFREENREIKPFHVQAFKDVLGKQGYDKKEPMKVTQEGDIIDGQHRYTACKELNIPFYYTIVEVERAEDFREEVLKFNSIQRPWGLKDFIGSYKNDPFVKFIIEMNKKYFINEASLIELFVRVPTLKEGSYNSKVTYGRLFNHNMQWSRGVNESLIEEYCEFFYEIFCAVPLSAKEKNWLRNSPFQCSLFHFYQRVPDKDHLKNRIIKFISSLHQYSRRNFRRVIGESYNYHLHSSKRIKLNSNYFIINETEEIE